MFGMTGPQRAPTHKSYVRKKEYVGIERILSDGYVTGNVSCTAVTRQ
jgi:hypothetical protein